MRSIEVQGCTGSSSQASRFPHAIVEDPLPRALVFSEEQGAVIAASLGDEIQRLRDEREAAQQHIASLQSANAALRARIPAPSKFRPVDDPPAQTHLTVVEHH